MKRFYLLLAVLAVGVAACHKEETPKEVIPPVEEEQEVDARLEFMNAACALGREVDDDLFLWHLENNVFYYDDDRNGTESGCSYGDIGMYVSKDGEITWESKGWSQYNNRVLIMTDDNVCRVHGIWGWYPDEEDNPHPEYGYDDKGFRNRYWRYDAEKNTLYTKMWNIEDTLEYSAEVLYVDSWVAILKGQVMGEPSKTFADWGYFYADFKKLDREEYMNEYNKNFTTWNDKDIEGDWEPIEMDKSVLTFGPEGGEQTTTSLNYDGLWLNDAYEEVMNEDGVVLKEKFVDASEDSGTIESSWYRVEIPEGRENTLVVTVEKNDTAIPRNAIIEFQVAGGDAFSFIEICQQ